MLSQIVFMLGIIALVGLLTIGGLAILINEFKGAWERGDLGGMFILSLIACAVTTFVGVLLNIIGL